MLALLSKHFKKVSVLRRLLFAAAYLHEDVPNRWELCSQFANGGSNVASGLTTDEAKMIAENIQSLDELAFIPDHTLRQELMQFPNPKPLGVILISNKDSCQHCLSKLSVRKDRPATITVYDDSMGPVLGTHFRKTCSNRACGYTYYYGYHTTGGSQSSSHTLYDRDWRTLPYFVSSRETAFSISLLRRFDSEIILGQMSFKQCADVYNHMHECHQKELQRSER